MVIGCMREHLNRDGSLFPRGLSEHQNGNVTIRSDEQFRVIIYVLERV
jgi:hypothetical protein